MARVQIHAGKRNAQKNKPELLIRPTPHLTPMIRSLQQVHRRRQSPECRQRPKSNPRSPCWPMEKTTVRLENGSVQKRHRVIPRGDHPRESHLATYFPTDSSSQSIALSVRWSSAPVVLKIMPCTPGVITTMRRACHPNQPATWYTLASQPRKAGI